jgi:hypothetical protein
VTSLRCQARVTELLVRKPFRIRNARIFLFGDVVSTLGDRCLWLAMAIWMKELQR